MKVCKHLKQELQAAKDSGMAQMLVDIEARCSNLEKDKLSIEDATGNFSETARRYELRIYKMGRYNKKTRSLNVCSLNRILFFFEGIVARKDEKLQQSRHQICEQQLAIENLKVDLQAADKKICSSPEHQQHDNQAELTVNSGTELVDFGSTQHDIHPEITFTLISFQLRFIKNRLWALKELVQAYEERNIVDINLLGDENSLCEDNTVDGTSAARSCEDVAVALSESVVEATQCLSELQDAVEDACARLMGSTCALQ
ncbi:unnamed protein product [Phytophthora fragariaefolia]|uniref:Unnamed protein product n=1 Tax=Phytophthora fragariaefolia TaxID=1490495 RepID=A0A9W6XFL3_9STRA|nr:unnamed protein product [Phytophthora fragariaefolia]